MATGLKQKTVSGVTWSFIERFSVQGVHFLIGIIMARLLTPSDYGLIGMLAIFMSLSQVFIDGGFSSALIQAKRRTEKDYSTVFYINLAISTFLYLLLFVSAPYIATFYEQPLLTDITRVYALNLIINSLVSVNKTKLVIAVDFRTQSKISFITAVLSGGVGIAAAMRDYGVWALVIQMVSGAIINVMLSFYYVKWIPKLVFSLRSFHNLFKFGSKLLIATIISSIYSNLYSLIIGKRYTSADLGVYTRADQFAQFTGTNISGILSRVCFPVLSSIQDDDDRLLYAYKRYIQMTAFIMFPIVLLLCGVARPLVLTLLGEKWEGSIPLLQILSLAYLFNGIVMINLNLLYVKGRSDLVLRLEIIKKSIALSILIISMFFGVKAICIGLVVYSLIGFYLNTIYTKQLLNYGFWQQVGDFWRYFIVSVGLFLLVSSICQWITQPVWALLTSCVVASVSYLVICRLFKFPAIYDFLSITHSIIHRNHACNIHHCSCI